MKKWMTILAALLAASCTTETYDSGNGKYSYLLAEFAEVHTAEAKLADYAVNDAGRHITFASPLAVRWADTPDTLYRALLYYNNTPAASEPLAALQVYVLNPLEKDSVSSTATDPVTLESTWQSENGRWLNLSLLVKTGKSEDENAFQSIGMMSSLDEDSLLHLTLLHDQGAVPQYYTTRVYVSVPLDDTVQLPLRLTVNTYEGPFTQTLSCQDGQPRADD